MATTQAAGKHAREYETIYVLRPDVARDSQEKIAARMGEAVTREGGKLTTIENWGRRQLAYAVKKAKRGVYVYVKYVGGGAAVAEVERNLRMLDDVLKYQTVQVRDDVDAATLTIDAEALKFEAVDLPGEDEVEDSIERQLGFEGGPERSARDDMAPDDEEEFENPLADNSEDAQ
jgi:small subunit ribosomal protein S6